MEKTCEFRTIIQKVSREFTATDPDDKDYKMVLFFGDRPLLKFSSDFHFSGDALVDVIVVRIYDETNDDYRKLMKLEWTDKDQKQLDYLTKVNQNTGILFNADHFDDLLKQKLGATFADGGNLNEASEDTVPMTLLVERLYGRSKLIYNITKTTTGKDLYDALTAKGIDMENVAVKWAGTASTIAMFDTLYTYACDGKEFVIRPTVMGGGKGIKKSSLKGNVKNMAMREKRDDLASQAQSVEVKMVKDGEEVTELAKQQLTTLYERVEQNPKQVLRDLLSSVPDDVLGCGIDDGESPLLDAYKKNRGNYRIQDLSDKVMRANFGALYDLSAEVDGLIETCGLTFDFLVHSLVMKETGEMDWTGLKRVLEDAITVRNATDDL
eukprot:Skav236623  [mRNA]  locus=scaffold182:29679:30821:- [translate_table: standard]